MRLSRPTLLALSASFAFGLPVAAAHAVDGATAAQPAADTTPPAADAPADAATGNGQIIVTSRRTRTSVTLEGKEIQKILPGVSPLKAIETLPGVLYITSDPWGNNEQNAQIFIHGFNFQQLGYTMDGVPLGDQSYGNYNGLAPERAVISENVGRIVVSTGAGDLGTASTSNLGGTIETYSSDPTSERGFQGNETVGSYSTSRTYIRLDSGNFGLDDENKFYISAARQHARAWDFDGIQEGYQANAKFVHEDDLGKLTLFVDYSDIKQPNEDATVFFKPSAGGTATAAQLYTPYTRPYYYPNFAGMRSYITAFGNTPAGQGSNYNNYYSDAQRTDYLAYARYDAHLSSKITWSTTGYYHHDSGAGIVNGPLGQSITVIQAYLDPNYTTDTHLKTNANTSAALVAATGGSGLVSRTTEYRIDREGVISSLNVDLGRHQIELGGWFEHNSATQWRRWYAVDVNNPQQSTPYIRPHDVENPLFTQYEGIAHVNDLELHIEDHWKPIDKLLVAAGFKTSSQWAEGNFPVQPVPGSLSGLTGLLPSGKIDTNRWFLPTVGATYDITDHEQFYANVQENLRQYMTYLGGGSLSPWFTGSQAAFDTFAQQGKPESSWTYEAGLRTHRSFSGLLSGIEAQVNYYHVVFNNRQLAIATNPGGIAGGGITGGTSILVNVGDVHTDGVDAAVTLHFGRAFSLYNSLSYNTSTYKSDYTSTASGIGAATGTCIGGYIVVNGVVPTCGKQVPGSPKWMNKTVATFDAGPFEAQFIGDFVGRRFATYTDDTSVPSYFMTSASLAFNVPEDFIHLKHSQVSLNVTNLTNIKGWSTISIGSATNNYSAYPIPPRQWFLTFKVGL